MSAITRAEYRQQNSFTGTMMFAPATSFQIDFNTGPNDTTKMEVDCVAGNLAGVNEPYSVRFVAPRSIFIDRIGIVGDVSGSITIRERI